MSSLAKMPRSQHCGSVLPQY